jgi:hypothetical protein
VRETDDMPATVWWGVQVRHSQFAHLHSALHACGNLVHLWLRLRALKKYKHECEDDIKTDTEIVYKAVDWLQFIEHKYAFQWRFLVRAAL